MADKPKTVTIKALQLHEYHGKDYKPGATYQADEGDVTTIEVQGKGERADTPTDAPTQAPAQTPKAPVGKPVAPLTTHDVPTAAPKPKK